jgi:chemotaxis protein MotA
MKSLSAVFYNFDIPIIVLCAFINLGVFIFALLQIRETKKILYPRSSIVYKTKANSEITGEEAQKLATKKSLLLFLYSSYANITAIFPLLGILGTVAALILLPPDGGEKMMENLMVALDTTLLGAVCAVLYKVLDSLLSGPIEAMCDDIDFVIRNYDDSEEKEKNEIQGS